MTPAEQMCEAAARSIEDVFARGAPGGRVDGRYVSPVEMRRNAIISIIRALPLPTEATEPDGDLLDWRKKAERMKETLIKADATLELISTMSQSRGEGPTVRECGRLAREAIATICEALGET